MACSSCKNKNKNYTKEELIKTSKVVSKVVLGFAIVWTLLGVYGFVTLISKLFF